MQAHLFIILSRMAIVVHSVSLYLTNFFNMKYRYTRATTENVYYIVSNFPAVQGQYHPAMVFARYEGRSKFTTIPYDEMEMGVSCMRISRYLHVKKTVVSNQQCCYMWMLVWQLLEEQILSHRLYFSFPLAI